MLNEYKESLRQSNANVCFTGFINMVEFLRLPLDDMKNYLYKLARENTFVQSRNSNQTWLYHYGVYDQLLESFHER